MMESQTSESEFLNKLDNAISRLTFPELNNGLYVQHKFGGSGHIYEFDMNATARPTFISVEWDTGGLHPRNVPLSSLIFENVPVSDIYIEFCKRSSLHYIICNHIKASNFDEAKRIFEDKCSMWWDENDFQGLIHERAAINNREKQRLIELAISKSKEELNRQRIIREKKQASYQIKTKAEILHKLKILDVEMARKLYDEACGSKWWPEHDFVKLCKRTEAYLKIADVYISGSLREIDELARELVSTELVSAEEISHIKIPKVKLRIARLGMPLDEEQLQACSRIEQHRLIRARAGSGKTRTLAAHAALVIHDEALQPDQVLILAFNKKAAKEIGDRVLNVAGIEEFRNARTFHSLAYQLADHAGRDLIFDDGNLSPSRRKQSGFVERLIGRIMNPAFRELLYEFFRRELEQLNRLGSNLSKEEYVEYRRSMADFTLSGETVKSNGEKFIADFLFEHGIIYKYEKVWSWDGKDRLYGTAYKPDFSIIYGGRDYILEHWAINPEDRSAEVPVWWEISTKDYLDQIKAKRKFWAERNVMLLETHTGMMANGREAFEASLKGMLERAGIRCQRLEHDELVRRVADAPRTVSRMAELFLQFISRAKKRGWTVEDIARILRDKPDPEPRHQAFHELAMHAYAAYERQLAEESAMDFDDLLISAAECVMKYGGSARIKVANSDSIAIRDLRWVLIDEFQDFSALYFRLINAILQANPKIRLVAVGDDWQAINGFAGAQLAFFNRFEDYFPGAGKTTISTNRRSSNSIVDFGNELMRGRGVPAIAHHHSEGDIEVVEIDKIWPENESIYIEVSTSHLGDGRKNVNWDLAKALKACSDYIAQSIISDATQNLRQIPSVLVLARTGRAYRVTLEEFANKLENVLRKHPKLQDLTNEFAVGKKALDLKPGFAPIEVMTAHKAKGKEAHTVIVLEATIGQFPKVHPDNLLFGLFGVTAEDVLTEERRLFYVSASRAEHRLMFLTESGKHSPYFESNTPNHGVTNNLTKIARLSDEAQALKARLDQVDSNFLIKHNVSEHAQRVLERLTDLGKPVVGYALSQEYFAELAWPDHNPPIAILTGRHRKHSEIWRLQGWEIQ